MNHGVTGKVMREERRRHPRVEIKWPAVLITTKGHIFGQTLDLGLGGALIRSLERADLVDTFTLIFKPSLRKSFMRVTAEEVWATTVRLDSNTRVHLLAVRFIEIFDDEDLHFLKSVISNHV